MFCPTNTNPELIILASVFRYLHITKLSYSTGSIVSLSTRRSPPPARDVPWQSRARKPAKRTSTCRYLGTRLGRERSILRFILGVRRHQAWAVRGDNRCACEQQSPTRTNGETRTWHVRAALVPRALLSSRAKAARCTLRTKRSIGYSHR